VTRHLTFEQLLAIATELPGDPACDDYSKLDAALARMRSHRMGRDVLGSDWLKAAALLETLARLKPLEDRNDLYAGAAAEAFLIINGRPLQFDPADMLQLAHDAEVGQVTTLQIAARLRSWAD